MRRVTLVALVLVVALGACGVPTDREPHLIETANVPFRLLAPTAEATSTTVPLSSATAAKVSIYLADAEGRLVATRRDVAAPATPARAITALLGGPTQEEADRLRTAITSDTKLLHVEGPVNGLVTLDLSRNLLDITGRQQILALAQVVYTVTSLGSVDRVLFRFDGDPREVPNGDGKLTASPLGRLSYRGLVGS